MIKNKFLLVALLSFYSVCISASELILHPGHHMQPYNNQDIVTYSEDQELATYNNDQVEEYNQLLPQIKKALNDVRTATDNLCFKAFGFSQDGVIKHFKLLQLTKKMALRAAQNQEIDKLKVGQATLNEWREACVNFKSDLNSGELTPDELGAQFKKILILELLMFHLVYTI
jgi:hypothetical protein